MISKIKGFLSENVNKVNIFSIVVSLLLVLLAYVPYGIAGAENILISIGCSGMAAGIMAIFINLAQKSQEDKKNKLLKKDTLMNLHYEMKSLFERLIWFDEVMESYDLDRDVDYYLSYEFMLESCLLKVYKQEDYEQFYDDIKRISNKYKKENWKDTEKNTYKQVEKMFNIIGNASLKINDELEKINSNSSFLIAYSMLSSEELATLNINISQHVKSLCVKDINYATSLIFLMKAYGVLKCTHCFDDEIYFITWHPKDNTLDLFLQYKKGKEKSDIEIMYTDK